MIKKNKEKQERKEQRKQRGRMWIGFRPVFELTKKQRLEKENKKNALEERD